MPGKIPEWWRDYLQESENMLREATDRYIFYPTEQNKQWVQQRLEQYQRAMEHAQNDAHRMENDR